MVFLPTRNKILSYKCVYLVKFISGIIAPTNKKQDDICNNLVTTRVRLFETDSILVTQSLPHHGFSNLSAFNSFTSIRISLVFPSTMITPVQNGC